MLLARRIQFGEVNSGQSRRQARSPAEARRTQRLRRASALSPRSPRLGGEWSLESNRLATVGGLEFGRFLLFLCRRGWSLAILILNSVGVTCL